MPQSRGTDFTRYQKIGETSKNIVTKLMKSTRVKRDSYLLLVQFPKNQKKKKKKKKMGKQNGHPLKRMKTCGNLRVTEYFLLS